MLACRLALIHARRGVIKHDFSPLNGRANEKMVRKKVLTIRPKLAAAIACGASRSPVAGDFLRSRSDLSFVHCTLNLTPCWTLGKGLKQKSLARIVQRKNQ